MTYALLTDGLDADGRAKIDLALEGAGSPANKKMKARRQRAGLDALRNVKEK